MPEVMHEMSEKILKTHYKWFCLENDHKHKRKENLLIYI